MEALIERIRSEVNAELHNNWAESQSMGHDDKNWKKQIGILLSVNEAREIYIHYDKITSKIKNCYPLELMIIRFKKETNLDWNKKPTIFRNWIKEQQNTGS